MKKTVISLLVMTLVIGGLANRHWYYLPRVISSIVTPIGDNQAVAWHRRPEAPRANIDDAPPNIILIVADDLGFNDISFYGGGIADGTVPTPNIASIGQQGIHFTNGYAGNGTCAPSRAALLTGSYPSRVGFEFTPVRPQFARLTAGDGFIEENAEDYPPVADLVLPPDEITLPELLKEKGYHSVAPGKWHLGESEGMRPNDRGFDDGDREIDDKNLLEYALDPKQPPHIRPLFWRTGGYKVVQLEGWKLQIQEQNNLAESDPKQLKKLTEALYAMDEQMVKPLWPTLAHAGRETHRS